MVRMPPVKYVDFEVSDPFTIRAKRNKDEEVVREYVSIKCPHCQKTIGDVLFDALSKMKATKCKAHLEVCPEFKAKGGNVEPAPARTGNAELMKELRKMREEVKESMAQISRGLGLGDPDATTQSEIIQRTKRKREEDEASMYKDINILSKIPTFKRAFETLKHEEKCTTEEERGACERMRERINEANKK